MKSKFIIGGFLLVILTIAGLGMNVFYSSQFVSDYLRITQLKKAYMEESAGLKELGTPEFEAYGGDLLVKVQVGEKGSVTFWYDPEYIPRLTVLNGTSVEHECKTTDSSGSFVMALDVVSTSVFIKDFGFEIRTLADLVAYFDKLVVKIDEYRNSPTYAGPVVLELSSLESVVACSPVHVE